MLTNIIPNCSLIPILTWKSRVITSILTVLSGNTNFILTGYEGNIKKYKPEDYNTLVLLPEGYISDTAQQDFH